MATPPVPPVSCGWCLSDRNFEAINMDWMELKCVQHSNSEEPFRRLTLGDLRGLVELDPDLAWGADPQGAIPIRNTDGSFTDFPPQEGFFFVRRIPFFCPCYEHDGGVTIHTKDDAEAEAKCRSIAAKLQATVFT